MSGRKTINDFLSEDLIDITHLLTLALGQKKEQLYTDSNYELTNKELKRLDELIQQRQQGKPFAYLSGSQGFYHLDFKVSPATLIPRPETELLIYKVVDFFKNKRINVLDIGTGSGCILLSILKELVHSRGIGIDISTRAIKMAQINSKNLNLFHQSKFKVFDISKFNVGKYDLIVSNPPYIPTKDIKNLSEDIINYEPLVALNGGLDGLDLIKKVIYKSNSLLKKNGLLAIEIGFNQYLKISSLLKQHGFREMSRQCDYSHNVRCIISTKV